MQPAHHIPAWKTAPFIRLLLPLIGGILLQLYIPFRILFIAAGLYASVILFTGFYYLPLAARYRWSMVQGGLLHAIILFAAMLLCRQQDIRNQREWYGHFYNDSSSLLVRIDEPPMEKPRSFKAAARVIMVINHKTTIAVKGKLLVYFNKNDSLNIRYGDQLLIGKKLQRIKNSGNPGAFDYQRYAFFQQLFHTIYLQQQDYQLLPQKSISRWNAFIFNSRAAIVHTLKKYIPGDKKIAGIAEALLIGYKEDLDKDLVQAYSNAGVVHIIAISGLHLGLIYVMLRWLFDRLPLIKRSGLAKTILVLSSLWLFSILTGSSASVLRSAVMFTCIVTGNNFFKQTSSYNSLAASAFILLCYDPYFLWDTGFQLSYLAVFGIMWLQRPVYRLLFFKQRWLDRLWSMISITLAAQAITFPVCIYYFHQFPNLFLLTNLIAVPLSTLILFVEIGLLAFAWLPFLAMLAGKCVWGLIWLMNYLIEACNAIPFAMIEMIYASIASTWLLYILVFSIAAWLLYRNKRMLRLALVSCVLFVLLHVFQKLAVQSRRKLIVYNVSKHRAVDIIYKNRYVSLVDTALAKDVSLQHFNLQPARVSLGLNRPAGRLPGLFRSGYCWKYETKTIVFIDSAVAFVPLLHKISADVLIISNNPSLQIGQVTGAIQPSIIVFDASNSLWKIEKWKKECEQLLLRCYSVAEHGAFVMDIE